MTHQPHQNGDTLIDLEQRLTGAWERVRKAREAEAKAMIAIRPLEDELVSAEAELLNIKTRINILKERL